VAGTKATKAKANYRAGEGDRRCGLCTMFRPPHSCTAVKGKVDASGLCNYFERKKRITTRGERWYAGSK
jgi:hypothetical protein